MKECVVGVNKEIQNVTSQTDEVEKSIEYHAGKVDQVEKEEEKGARMNSDINEKLQALENKLTMLEKHDRKFILIFHGIAEEWRDYNKMRSFFVSDMKIEQERASKIHFLNGQRLPTETYSVGPASNHDVCLL